MHLLFYAMAFANHPLGTQPSSDLVMPTDYATNRWIPPAEDRPATIASIRSHMTAGDEGAALAEATRLSEEKRWGRQRDAALMAVGMLNRAREEHNLASRAFAKVRGGKGPLAHLAAYYEAEQDLKRGREWVAIRECERLVERDEDARFNDRCARLEALARAKMGQAGSARSVARTYDKSHEKAPISETIELELAQTAWRKNKKKSLPLWKRLAVHHRTPLAGRLAEQRIAELAELGVEGAEIPSDVESLKARAISLRDARRRDLAWSLFEELAKNPKTAGWADSKSERFGWRTHRWDHLVSVYRARYRTSATPRNSWMHYRALFRAGRYKEAVKVAKAALEKHSRTGSWRNKEEDLGHTAMLAGDYDTAVQWFAYGAKRSGSSGRRAAFYEALCTFLSKNPRDSLKLFGPIIEDDPTNLQARYWRARVNRSLERFKTAELDFKYIRESSKPDDWYAILVGSQGESLPTSEPYRRQGSWPQAPLALPQPSVVGFLGEQVDQTPKHSIIDWVFSRHVSDYVAYPEPLGTMHWQEDMPSSYRSSTFYNPSDAEHLFASVATKAGDDWPELKEINDLASVGLFDLSGPLMSSFYREYKEAKGSRRHPRHRAAASLDLSKGQWRQLFTHARDHHNTARSFHRLWEKVDEKESIEAFRIAHPVAHDIPVWKSSRDNNIDPFLIMGLMRQESTYNPVAISRVGASGAMQIMPRTGHLLADLLDLRHFSAGDLEDPVVSVQMGIHYMGLLMERFDGVYPLAIASYNGGPFNVSTWKSAMGDEVELDLFVEHIPYRETRDYVKKVSRGYASYVRLYGQDGSQIVLPELLAGDDATVVDF